MQLLGYKVAANSEVSAVFGKDSKTYDPRTARRRLFADKENFRLRATCLTVCSRNMLSLVNQKTSGKDVALHEKASVAYRLVNTLDKNATADNRVPCSQNTSEYC